MGDYQYFPQQHSFPQLVTNRQSSIIIANLKNGSVDPLKNIPAGSH